MRRRSRLTVNWNRQLGWQGSIPCHCLVKITKTVILFGSAVLALLLICKPKPGIIYIQPDMQQYIRMAEHKRCIKKLNEMNIYRAEKDKQTILMLKAKLEK